VVIKSLTKEESSLKIKERLYVIRGPFFFYILPWKNGQNNFV